MYVRVTTFEGAEADNIDAMAARVGEADGPPPGVPSSRFLMLADREKGKVLAIGFFETEEDRTTGDAALSAMDPPAPMGDRTSVEMYEVMIERSADETS